MFSSQALSSFMNDSAIQPAGYPLANYKKDWASHMDYGFYPNYEHVWYRRNRLDTSDSGYDASTCCSNSESEGPAVNIENEIFSELRKNRQIPYRDYTCHRCLGTDHMIKYCPTRDPTPMTPYQGDNISRGAFRCKCGRTWKSDYVVANKSYTCHNCQTPNFPVKMWKKYNNIQGKYNRFHVPLPTYSNAPYRATNLLYTYCS